MTSAPHSHPPLHTTGSREGEWVTLAAALWLSRLPGPTDLRHVDQPHSQCLVAKDRAVLVALSPLQHYLKFVGITLEEMRVLQRAKRVSGQVGGARWGRAPFLGTYFCLHQCWDQVGGGPGNLGHRRCD